MTLNSISQDILFVKSQKHKSLLLLFLIPIHSKFSNSLFSLASKRKVQQESEDEDESQNNEDSMDLASSTDVLPVLQSDKKKEVDGKKKKGGKQKVDQQEIRRKVRAAVQKQKSNAPTSGFGFGASSVVSKYNIEVSRKIQRKV